MILACIVYWQAREISRVLSQRYPVGNGIDLSLLEHVSPIEWDNVVLYGQYILDRKLVRRRRRAMGRALECKITRICLAPFFGGGRLRPGARPYAPLKGSLPLLMGVL